MNIRNLFLLLLTLVVISCNSDDEGAGFSTANKILVLKVDYTTYQFEGGKELKFSEEAEDFSIKSEYVAPGDFGSVKLIYSEIKETLFFGEIIWMGTGKVLYPKWADKSLFEETDTKDIIYPSGFEEIANQLKDVEDQEKVWMSVQRLIKVREYIRSNPTQSVKIFLYTPSVGVGDPETWKWIVFLKS